MTNSRFVISDGYRYFKGEERRFGGLEDAVFFKTMAQAKKKAAELMLATPDTAPCCEISVVLFAAALQRECNRAIKQHEHWERLDAMPLTYVPFRKQFASQVAGIMTTEYLILRADTVTGYITEEGRVITEEEFLEDYYTSVSEDAETPEVAEDAVQG